MWAGYAPPQIRHPRVQNDIFSGCRKAINPLARSLIIYYVRIRASEFLRASTRSSTSTLTSVPPSLKPDP